MHPVTLCWSAEPGPPMSKTGQEVLRCAYPGCENQPRPAEVGAAAEPGHCGPPDPGDRAAAHGADRAPAPPGAGAARWRDGPGRRTGPPGVRGAAISPRWRAAPPARRGRCRGGARDGAGSRCVADRGAGRHAARRRPPGNLATSSYQRRATIMRASAAQYGPGHRRAEGGSGAARESHACYGPLAEPTVGKAVVAPPTGPRSRRPKVTTVLSERCRAVLTECRR